jgi:ribonucleotide monophosphatase NagD (HAD superfamily)
VKTTNQIKSELTNDKRTLEKRREVKEKLKVLGETEENTERILTSIECYCQLVLQSIKKSEYG